MLNDIEEAIMMVVGNEADLATNLKDIARNALTDSREYLGDVKEPSPSRRLEMAARVRAAGITGNELFDHLDRLVETSQANMILRTLSRSALQEIREYHIGAYFVEKVLDDEEGPSGCVPLYPSVGDQLGDAFQPKRILQVTQYEHAEDELAVVFCQTDAQYAVWTFNAETRGFAHGGYYDDFAEAAEAYDARVERYAGGTSQ